MKASKNGALLMLVGSNSPAALRSLPIRVLILDEVDGYPGDVGGEGDPVDLAAQRTETYGSYKKILCISMPRSRAQAASGRCSRVRIGDEHVPCPACCNWIVLEFPQLYVADGKVLYRCQTCGAGIGERDKLAMLEAPDLGRGGPPLLEVPSLAKKTTLGSFEMGGGYAKVLLGPRRPASRRPAPLA